MDGYLDWNWMMYWTHLSNLGALIWISLAFLAVTIKSEKIESFVQNWNIKNTVFTFILVTGIVFMTLCYIPTLISYATPGPIKEVTNFESDHILWLISSGDSLTSELSDSYNLMSNGPTAIYRFFVILGTTIKHLIIPGMFLYLAVTERGYVKKNENITDGQRSMILFILPVLYLTYTLVFGSMGLANPPYPVLDFDFTTYDNDSVLSLNTINISFFKEINNFETIDQWNSVRISVISRYNENLEYMELWKTIVFSISDL